MNGTSDDRFFLCALLYWDQSCLHGVLKSPKQTQCSEWQSPLLDGSQGETREAGGRGGTALPPQPHFRLLLVSVVWKTLEADMRFSMYWPRTWFSDFNLRFSSFTASTLADRSAVTTKTNQTHIQEFHAKKILNGVD